MRGRAAMSATDVTANRRQSLGMSGQAPRVSGDVDTGSRVLPTLALMLSDGMAFAIVWACAGALPLPSLPESTVTASTGTESIVPGLIAVAAVVSVCGKLAAGWYPGYGLFPEARLRRAAVAWLGAGATATGAGVALANAGSTDLLLFWAALAFTGLLQAAFGYATVSGLRAVRRWGVPARVTGDAERVAGLERVLRETPSFGYLPVPAGRAAATVLWTGPGLPDPEELARLGDAGREVILVADLPKLPLTGIHPARCGGAFGLRLTCPAHHLSHGVTKRALDLMLAVPLGLLALPVVALAALLVRMSDPGPAFFVQQREGHRGRVIGMLKLRTMYLDADRMLAELLERDPQARAQWNAHFKLPDDPRVLPVIGRFLRASSLDELPQLWNVIRGDMSLVGPRPFPDYHLAAMPPVFRQRRASVVPGLTGLWQISERSDADIAAQEALDGFYIDGRTLWGDLSILLRTISAVLGRRGAY